MNSNSDLTIQTYRENFEKYVARTGTEPRGEFKELLDLFASCLPEMGSIFEIGSASGRDARYLAASHFNYHSEPEISGILTGLFFEILSISHAEQGKWLHVIARTYLAVRTHTALGATRRSFDGVD